MNKFALITIVLSLNWAAVHSQTFKVDENYTSTSSNLKSSLLDTVVISSNSKAQLYSNALAYISSTFTDSRSVIETKDSELGEIAFKGSSSVMHQGTIAAKKGKEYSFNERVTLYFKCRVYVKEGKFKIVLSSLEQPYMPGLTSGIKVPISLPKPTDAQNVMVARGLAMDLIKTISARLNQKPESKF
jgi:hypothetical protein